MQAIRTHVLGFRQPKDIVPIVNVVRRSCLHLFRPPYFKHLSAKQNTNALKRTQAAAKGPSLPAHDMEDYVRGRLQVGLEPLRHP